MIYYRLYEVEGSEVNMIEIDDQRQKRLPSRGERETDEIHQPKMRKRNHQITFFNTH